MNKSICRSVSQIWEALQAGLVGLQAANLLFGAAAEPHDFLHEPLFRLLSTGLLSSAASAFALKVIYLTPSWHLSLRKSALNIQDCYWYSGGAIGEQGLKTCLSDQVGASQGSLNRSYEKRLELGLILFATLNTLLATSTSAQPDSVLTFPAYWSLLPVFGLTMAAAWGGCAAQHSSAKLPKAVFV